MTKEEWEDWFKKFKKTAANNWQRKELEESEELKFRIDNGHFADAEKIAFDIVAGKKSDKKDQATRKLKDDLDEYLGD